MYPTFLVIYLVTGNIGRDGDKREDTPDRSNRKQLFIEVEQLNVYQSTQTYILLAALIFPK